MNDRLAKLVALARDLSNPHEAASAARKAQALIRERGLVVSKVEARDLALARVRGLKAQSKGVTS